jgi:signal transduction protein with GAF and PtsI domain
MVALLTASMVLLATAPAFADADPLAALQNLMQQEQQTQVQGAAEASSVGDANALLAPTSADMEMDVDAETGDTHEERVTSYVAKLEAEAKMPPTSIPKPGWAWPTSWRASMTRRWAP